MNVIEDSDGYLSKSGDQEMELNAIKEFSKKLKSDNEELRRRLSMMDRLSAENSKLRKVKEELQASLNDAQEDISVLIKEKRILQESVIDLQNQLPSGALGVSSRGFAWPNKR